MEQQDKDNVKIGKTFSQWLKDRFSLDDDKAQRDEVVAAISKGVEFRGVNLWVLIFATMIASLGLNVNSAAVIIGAMLISPIMGPIMGIGLSLGINDFDLLKRSLRNFTLMFVIAIITSTLYFFSTPLGSARSELLARTVPTTYDVFIAFFGGLAGIVAQSRKDRTSTVIPGVAIATALIPPLCTAGFGIATGQLAYFLGAFYLFVINSVFIALATFLIVRFLRYEKKEFIDKVRERNVRRMMMVIALITFVPSVFIGMRMVRVSIFESKVEKYVHQVFDFDDTRVIECRKHFHDGSDAHSDIELLLVGQPLDQRIIENAKAQLGRFGLDGTDLIVRQASAVDEIDVNSLQNSFAGMLDEKNRQLDELRSAVSGYKVTAIDAAAISREAMSVVDNIGSLSLSKSVMYDAQGAPVDTVTVCVIMPIAPDAKIDQQRLSQWLKVRMGTNSVKLLIER